MSDSQADSDPKPNDLLAMPNKDRPVEEPTGKEASPESVAGPCTLLAQIPDIGEPAEGEDVEGLDTVAQAGDGRILSPGLSAKILVGGGLFLLLVAVMPFIFGGKEDAKTTSTDGDRAVSKESPVPEPPIGPKWEDKTAEALRQKAIQAAKAPLAKRKTPPAAKAPLAKQKTPPAAEQPGLPPFDSRTVLENGPFAAPSDDALDTRDPVVNQRTAITRHPNAPAAYYQHAHRDGAADHDRSGHRHPHVVSRQTPTYDRYRNDPNARRPYARTQQAARPAVASSYPDTGYPTEYAQGYRPAPDRAAPRTYYSESPAAGRRYADPALRVADRRPSAPPRGPATLPPPADETGIARFKGIIEKPTTRTTHDGAGSRVH